MESPLPRDSLIYSPVFMFLICVHANFKWHTEITLLDKKSLQIGIPTGAYPVDEADTANISAFHLVDWFLTKISRGFG